MKELRRKLEAGISELLQESKVPMAMKRKSESCEMTSFEDGGNSLNDQDTMNPCPQCSSAYTS